MRAGRLTWTIATVLSVLLALASGSPVNAALKAENQEPTGQETTDQEAADGWAVPDGPVEVRVGARWLPDGRVEVGLQVRSGQGPWGEHLLPRKRLMPASSTRSRWLSTSPVAVPNAEVRAVAQWLAKGAVRVGLRERALDGDWSERMLPSQRVLYESYEPGAWSWSAPVRVDPLPAQVVAFYGHPGVRAMGALGHGTPAEVAEQISPWVEHYDRLNGPRGAVGAYHLITGVAQAYPTSDGLWLYRLPHDRIAEYVEAARQHGMLVFLDNQIGWSDPLTEVKLLEPFLREPFVHMALDPEFATEPLGVRPGLAIGGITGAQVDEVLGYLSKLVAEEGIPTKILMVHQFTGRMLHDRDVIGEHRGVELSIDMDGIGSPGAKLKGYGLFAATEPSKRPAFKLFFTQDTPLMTPEDVQAMEPVPDLIIYQ